MTLREVSAETLQAVLELSVSREQEAYVASNAKSIAEAHFQPEAWFRAIYAGNTPVGFLMIRDENLNPLDLLVSHVRSRPNAHTLLTSCRPGEASAEPFCLKCGFRRTSKVDHGEIELALRL